MIPSLIAFIRRARCGLGFHRWAYMGEAVARSTPHIEYPVNQVCLRCRVLRFNADAPLRPTPAPEPFGVTEARRLERIIAWYWRHKGPYPAEVDRG